MASVIPTVRGPGGFERNLAPGDAALIARTITPIATVGAGTWTAAAITSGYIRRTGPTGAYTDTVDTGQNILTALRGNAPAAQSLVGLSLEFTVANTVAFLATVAAGRGVVLGTLGGALNIAASGSKDFLLTIQNDTPEVTVQGVATGNNVFTFTLPTGQSALPLGSAPGSLNITPGMLVAAGGGTGAIGAGATVTSIKLGQGGIVGITCSVNIAATITAVILSPRLELNNIGLD